MVRARVAPSAPSRAPASRRRSQATTRTRRAPTNGPGHPRLLLYIPAFLLLSSAPAPHTPPPAAKKHSTHDRPLLPPPQHTTMHAHPAHTNTRQPSPHRPAQHTQHSNEEHQNCPIAASPHHTPRGAPPFPPDSNSPRSAGGSRPHASAMTGGAPAKTGGAATGPPQKRTHQPCHAKLCSAMQCPAQCHTVPHSAKQCQASYVMICHDNYAMDMHYSTRHQDACLHTSAYDTDCYIDTHLKICRYDMPWICSAVLIYICHGYAVQY
jgi:hypothetical protein